MQRFESYALGSLIGFLAGLLALASIRGIQDVLNPPRCPYAGRPPRTS
jgi:hypothetical protein